jgi:hypothetical protein
LGSLVLKLVRSRESNIQEFTVERLLEGADDDDENDDEPLIQ